MCVDVIDLSITRTNCIWETEGGVGEREVCVLWGAGVGGGGTLIATVNNNVHLSCAHQRPER